MSRFLSRLARRWRRFLALSTADRRVLLGLLHLQTRAALYLWLGGLAYARRRMARLGSMAGERRVIAPRGSAVATGNAELAERYFRLALMAANAALYRQACLPRSLALVTALERRGLAAELRVGIRPGGAPLAAHAWVEVDGRVLGGEATENYQAFHLPELQA